MYVIVRPNQYSKITEEEFEKDTKRDSLQGAVVIGLEHSLRRREAEQMIEEKLRIDKDATPASGEPPVRSTNSVPQTSCKLPTPHLK